MDQMEFEINTIQYITINSLIIHQIWGYKDEEKLHLGVCKQKKRSLNSTAIDEYFKVSKQ
jgi:hypothetical protein